MSHLMADDDGQLVFTGREGKRALVDHHDMAHAAGCIEILQWRHVIDVGEIVDTLVDLTDGARHIAHDIAKLFHELRVIVDTCIALQSLECVLLPFRGSVQCLDVFLYGVTGLGNLYPIRDYIAEIQQACFRLRRGVKGKRARE